MAAFAPLNLLVILNTHVPEVLGGDAYHGHQECSSPRCSSPRCSSPRCLREDDIKSNFQQPGDLSRLSGSVEEDAFDEDAVKESFQASAALSRSLKIRCHPSGGDLTGVEDAPLYSSPGLGASARCSASSPGRMYRASGDGGYSMAGHSLAGTAMLGAMGIAAFGYSPKGSSSGGSRAVGAAIFGALGAAAFGGDASVHPSAGSSDEALGKVFDKGTLGSDSSSITNSSVDNNTNSSVGNSDVNVQALNPFKDALGLSVEGSTSSKSGSSEVATCQCSCPNASMVMVSRQFVEQAAIALRAVQPNNSLLQSEEKFLRLVMSYENVLALVVITVLSIFGAIYLWKICTRRRCVCKVCRNQYRTLHLLGSGGYGQVYLVDRVNDGHQFVSKRIPVNDITEFDEYSLEAKELVKLRHKHIVSYEDDFVHVEYGTLEPKTFLVIIMEFCTGGDLKEKIEADFYSFTEDYVRTVFAEILEAVQYLHSKNVIHRDLKSQNVFLAEDGRVKLGDFGLCKHAKTLENKGGACASLTHAGTDCYMAPEMLSSSKYGKPADMWSLGCVLFELVTGQFMWELDGILGAMIMKNPQIVQKLLKENLVPSVGNTIASLLKRLLSASPSARPTVTTCMRKKLFKPGFHLSRETFGDGCDALDDQTPPGGAEELSGNSSIRGLDASAKPSSSEGEGSGPIKSKSWEEEETPNNDDWLKPKRRKSKKKKGAK